MIKKKQPKKAKSLAESFLIRLLSIILIGFIVSVFFCLLIETNLQNNQQGFLLSHLLRQSQFRYLAYLLCFMLIMLFSAFLVYRDLKNKIKQDIDYPGSNQKVNQTTQYQQYHFQEFYKFSSLFTKKISSLSIKRNNEAKQQLNESTFFSIIKLLSDPSVQDLKTILRSCLEIKIKHSHIDEAAFCLLEKEKLRPVVCTAGGKKINFLRANILTNCHWLAKETLNQNTLLCLCPESIPAPGDFENKRARDTGIKSISLISAKLADGRYGAILLAGQKALEYCNLQALKQEKSLAELLFSYYLQKGNHYEAVQTVDYLGRIVQKTPIPIVISDPSGKVLYLNPAFTEKYGFQLDDLAPYTNWVEKLIQDKKTADKILKYWKNSKNSASLSLEAANPLESSVKTKSKDSKQVEISLSYTQKWLIYVFLDISEHKEIETALKKRSQELEEVQAFLLTAIENSPAGILIADAPFVRIRIANAAALALRGKTEKPLLSIDMKDHPQNWQFFYPDGRPYQAEDLPLSRAVIKGESCQATEMIIKQDNKNSLLLLAYSAPVKNNQGEILAGIMLFLDITEKHKLEEELGQSQKMESIGQLAGGIAHDFNNQLTGILGFAELLKQELQEKNHQFYVKGILNSAHHAANLIQKLLTFARKASNQFIYLDLHELINETISMLAHTINPKIKIRKDLQAGNAKIKGDAAQIQNALLNLALNAKDVLPDGGWIEFASRECLLESSDPLLLKHKRPGGNYLRVSIRDNGPGIPQQIQEHVFEPFFTTKSKGEGTGMGLAAVYGTVMAHQGSILLNSKTGKGAEFVIFLPSAEKDTVQTKEKKPRHKTLKQDMARILLVDDEENVREMAEAMLQKAGYTIITAANGREALEIFKQEKNFDLLLIDFMMPEMDGAELFGEVRKIDPEIKVLLASGYGENTRVQQMLKEGLLDFIPKPYLQNELLFRVKKALSSG